MNIKNDGFLVYEGKSLIEPDKNIAVILTGINNPSSNRKTGALVQSWIICADTHPIEATRTGEDDAICGNCPFKRDSSGKRICYVNLLPVANVYRKYKEGRYPPIKNLNFLKNRGLRIASYGEATAVSIDVWKPLIKKSLMWTGYSHRFRECDQEWRHYLQASVESEADKELATSMGWRTFRVKLPDAPKLKNEIICPATLPNSEVQCLNCGLCNGSQADVCVDIHGIGKRYFQSEVLV